MTLIRAGLIGAGLSRSRFAAGLDLLCRAQGHTLEFTPIDMAGDPDFDLAATLLRLRAQGWTGVNITHPLKPAAAGFAGDGMAHAVRHLGAANQLLFRPATTGHNTDFTGFLAAWRHLRRPTPDRVAVAGAGGVARAIVPALARLGALDIAVWDLEPDQARDLARLCGPPVRAIPAHDAPVAIRAAGGLVNTTPLGMHGHPGSAFDPAEIGGQSWAFDAVYTPVETPFLKTCASPAASRS